MSYTYTEMLEILRDHRDRDFSSDPERDASRLTAIEHVLESLLVKLDSCDGTAQPVPPVAATPPRLEANIAGTFTADDVSALSHDVQTITKYAHRAWCNHDDERIFLHEGLPQTCERCAAYEKAILEHRVV